MALLEELWLDVVRELRTNVVVLLEEVVGKVLEVVEEVLEEILE
jgi:hypothetical protein